MKAISTHSAPATVGPYSQAVLHDGMLLVSGQLPIDPISGSISANGLAEQTRQCFANIAAIAQAAGIDMAHCLRTTTMLRDMTHFAEINTVYGNVFTEPYPARIAFGVVALPKDALVEIEATFAVCSSREDA